MPRRALATLLAPTLNKVSAGSPCLVPPGSHRRPLKRSGSTACFVKKMSDSFQPPAQKASTTCQIPSTSREVGPSRPPYTARHDESIGNKVLENTETKILPGQRNKLKLHIPG